MFETKYWKEPIAHAKSSSESILKEGETAIWQMEGEKHLFQAKKENVDLQLEAVYRQRLAEVHTEVKRRLVCLELMCLWNLKLKQTKTVKMSKFGISLT